MVEDYNSRITYFTTWHDRVASQSKKISIFRLFIFLTGSIAVYFMAVYVSITAVFLTIFVSVILFALTIKYHSRVLFQLRLLKAYKKVNTNENKASDGNFTDFAKGDEFQNPDHPFAFDIDLFGLGSLFQFLNRTVTKIGGKQLAKKLTENITDKSKIEELQSFIDFLANNLEWRQKFLATGLAHNEGSSDTQKITDWVNLPAIFKHKVYLVLVICIPVFTTLFTLLLSMNFINFQNYLLYLMIPLGIAGSFIKRTNTRHSLVSKTSDMLVKYSLLLKVINELKSENSSRFPIELQEIEADVAHKQLKSLSSILNALDNRLNPISWTLLNGIFLWDILQMIRLEKWQDKNKLNLQQWFELVAEIDALISLGNYNFNHKDAVVPVFTSNSEIVSATELGHPLIRKSDRVANDVFISKGSFVLITGANMAGKSTYLRTIAISMVLAMNGCRVPAKEYKFSPILLYTSIRTQDSLHKSESYFYAELKRLKSIIDVLRSGTEIFIILDEILKGTNSKDKHHGSEALLKQLIEFETSGIVATHDIMLGELEQVFPQNISNFCFEVDIRKNKLEFDYKLRKGVSQNMNATLLMRQMGITV